jgi:hypothetical protein
MPWDDRQFEAAREVLCDLMERRIEDKQLCLLARQVHYYENAQFHLDYPEQRYSEDRRPFREQSIIVHPTYSRWLQHTELYGIELRKVPFKFIDDDAKYRKARARIDELWTVMRRTSVDEMYGLIQSVSHCEYLFRPDDALHVIKNGRTGGVCWMLPGRPPERDDGDRW